MQSVYLNNFQRWKRKNILILTKQIFQMFLQLLSNVTDR